MSAAAQPSGSGRQSYASPRWLAWGLSATVLWGLVTILFPFLIVLAVSLAERETYGTIRWTFTLANYTDIWHPLYARIFLQSIGLAAVATVACAILGFPLAYLLARAAPLWQQVGLVLVVIPLWTNFLVRTYAWMVLLRAEGVVNTSLQWLGLIDGPLPLLFTPGAVLLGLISGYLPFMILPMYAALERVPPSLEEAAGDLYASPWTMLRCVTLPLAMPGIVSGCLLVFLASVGAYLTPDMLGGAKTMMIGNLIQHEFLVARDWPLGAALATVLMLVALALVGVARRWEQRTELHHQQTAEPVMTRIAQ